MSPGATFRKHAGAGTRRRCGRSSSGKAAHIPTNAGGSAEQQLRDIEKLVADGVDALIIQPVDKEAIGLRIDRAAAAES